MKLDKAGLTTALACGIAAATLYTAVAATERPHIRLRVAGGELQIGTEASSPFYLQWRTPDGHWQTWNASTIIPDGTGPIWLRGVFEPDDPTSWELPLDVGQLLSPDYAVIGEDALHWSTIGQMDKYGEIRGANQPLVIDMIATFDSFPSVPDSPPRNNQAKATPDPGTTIIYWLHNSDGRFATWIMSTSGVRKASGLANATAPGGWQVVGVGDIDRDGIPDIMWFRPSDGAMAYWLMEPDGYRKAAGSMEATAPGGWQVVGTGDINGNGTTDIMWFRPSDGAMAYWFLNPDGTRASAGSMEATAPGGWQVVGTGDINRNGRPDLMWFRPSDGAMAYWFLNADGTRASAGLMEATAPGGWQVVGTGDINGNGTTDIMWFRPSDGAMAYWFLNPDGTRASAGSMEATAPGGWQVVGTGDINGNGRPDIMWFRPSDGAMAYWFLNADGTRKAAGLMGATAPGGWQAVGTGNL